MAEQRAQRRLAAIMSADVVGYSRLMRADELGTLEELKRRRRAILSPLVAKYQGRVVKVMGDGVLLEFASAVNAVQCALDLQTGMAKANEPLPQARHIMLRIGVNLGDVIVEGGDIYGDGVNVAARLEGLAAPGGICISASVHDEVRRRIDKTFEDLGTRQLKNIADPVHAFAFAAATGSDVAGDRPVDTARSLPSKPSIAVLPFTDMGQDQAYFADGITEDIITELSRFKGLLVIGRNSTFAYKGRSPDLRDVGRELGVHYLVEGSIRRAAQRLRVTAQLIEAASGSHVWAERYDRDLAEILEVQDELVRTIVATIGDRVEAAGKERARRLSDRELRAYDSYLRATAAEDRNTRDDYALARKHLQQAIEDDPLLAQAHHHLSLVNYVEWMAFWVGDRDQAFADAMVSARRALDLDDVNSSLQAHYGMLLMYGGEYDRAELHFDRALSLNPNDAKAKALHGFFLTAIGRPAEAIGSFDLAARLNPFQPSWSNWLKGIAFFTARRYGEAIVALHGVTSPINEVRGWLAASHALAGELDEARRALTLFLTAARREMVVPPEPTIAAWRGYWHGAIPYRRQEDFEHLFEGLRKAGMPA